MTHPTHPLTVRVGIEVGATFAGRSFGDKAQLVPLIKAAISHRGFALLDASRPASHSTIIRDQPRATRVSESTMKPCLLILCPPRGCTTSYDAGVVHEVCMHDGSVLRLQKVNEEYDIEDAQSALDAITYHARKAHSHRPLYINWDSEELHDVLQTAGKPLNTLSQRELSRFSLRQHKRRCAKSISALRG